MSTQETLVKGKPTRLESLAVGGTELIIDGKGTKTARLADEWYEDVTDPEALVQGIKSSGVRADIFTFWQRLPDVRPHFNYHLEWDSIAALPIATFEQWQQTQLNPKSRNLVRKAAKAGVVVRETDFSDAFVAGMTEIFNETPVRQDKPFWHYGKDTATVKREFSRYLFREQLFGAYVDDTLIGFIFLAHATKYALLGQILSATKHRDKAPNNALIAKAVEVCASKNIPYLVYAMWTEGSLGHFKRQNGFQRFNLPRSLHSVDAQGETRPEVGSPPRHCGGHSHPSQGRAAEAETEVVRSGPDDARGARINEVSSFVTVSGLRHINVVLGARRNLANSRQALQWHRGRPAPSAEDGDRTRIGGEGAP